MKKPKAGILEIADLIIQPEILDKLIWKHNVTESEVRQVFLDKPRYRFIEKGRYKGEHLYLALGTTDYRRREIFSCILYI